MYIVAKHEISDPQAFWQAAQERIATLPAEVRLHQVLPNQEGSRAICLWEAATVEQVRDVVEGAVGRLSTNRYFGVAVEQALGLPSAVRGQAVQS